MVNKLSKQQSLINDLASLEDPVNRRKDNKTRDAIDAILELLFDPDASSRIFQLVLNYCIDISDSEYGACFVCGDDAELPILSDTTLDILYGPGSPHFVKPDVLLTWVSQKNLLSSPIFYNAPIPEGAGALLDSNKSFSAMMVLPIIIHNQLRAVCVLANETAKKEYDANLLKKLKPLVGAVMCTIQSAETVRGNFSGLNEEIADNKFLSSLISSSPVGVIVIDSGKKIILSNPVAQDMFFHTTSTNQEESNQPLIGIDIHRFIPDFESLFQWSNQQSKFGSRDEAIGPRLWEEQHAVRYDGSECIVNLTLFRYTHGAQRFTTLQIQDITKIRQSAEDYKRATQQLNALTQLAPVAILRITNEWHCVFANEKWYEFSGLSHNASDAYDWINAIHSNDVSEFLEALRNSLNECVNHNQEVRLVSPMGATMWVDFSMRVLFTEEGEVEGFLGTCADVTERYINQEKLRHIAEYDGLTGLANRVLFQDRLQQAFFASQRDHSVVSIFFLDLDGFKDINDTLGHNTGDVLLQKIAERLMNTLRQGDTVARFGGDEFVVLLGKDDHLPEVLVVAKKVIEAVSKPYIIDGNEVFITTSLGIAQGDHSNSTAETLIKNADFALYNAKKEGKNKFQLFNAELEAGSNERVSLLKELRTGMKEDRFCLHYQAISDSDTFKVVGFESLLRFNSQYDGLVMPDRFIPMLEESSMIIEVGRWVIEETCRQLGDWQKNDIFPENGYLTFNVSAKQLLDEKFVEHIVESCARFNVDPHYLIMEMTESVIINKPEKVKHILRELKSFGMRLALDDFGTGYSSLSYLQNYSFDIIKIDKSFIDDLSVDSNDTKIVKAIIALAASLEVKVVAEGVETKFARETTKKLGAKYFQGYYLSKPIPEDLVMNFLLSDYAHLND